jgi:hypothetical protein
VCHIHSDVEPLSGFGPANIEQVCRRNNLVEGVDAVKHYREDFGPAMHRENSTFDVCEGRIKNHLEAYWEDVPIEHITIDAVNE